MITVLNLGGIMVKKIKILFVEDDKDYAYLIAKLLENEDDFEICGSAPDSREAIRLAESLLPEVVLMDLKLLKSELDGISTAKEIRLKSDAKIIFLTACEDTSVILDACKSAFASGYVFKSQKDILAETIRTAINGKTPQATLIRELILSKLSNAEKFVLQQVISEKQDFYTSEKTIANQKTNIFKKLGVKNSVELKKLFNSYNF